MAMTLDTAIKFTAKLEGTGLDQLKRNLQGLSQQSGRTSKDLDQLYNASRKLSTAAGQSINSLQRQVQVMTNLRNEAQIGSRQFKFYTAELEKLQRQQAQLSGAGSGRGGVTGLLAMGGGLGGLAAAAGGTLAVKYVADVGMAAENAQVRLRALTNEFGEYNQAQAATARIAQTLRISNTEAQDSFASLYASLRPTGITITELEKAFIGFSAAARNSGATAQETSNALIQLKQGLASGVLQGEELRSIREQAPLAAQAIAKELGVSIGELKNLAAEGKVTTDVVLRALGKLSETQLDKLNEQFNTGAQALKDLRNATDQLGIALAKTFGPTNVALIQAFTRMLERIGAGGEGRQREVLARLQAGAEAQKLFGRFGSITNRDLFNAFIDTRSKQLYDEATANAARISKEREANKSITADQQAARDEAAKERQAAKQRAAMDEAKKKLSDQLKIREDMEKRLADFREQSIRRAADLERDLGDQRLQLERSTAEARRRVQAQQQGFELERQRLQLRAAGLSTDALDVQAKLNEGTRRYTEQKIQIEQQATDRKTQIERTLADYQLEVARGISKILQDAGDKLAQKMAAGGQAAAAAMTGGAMAAPGGIIARTGNTGQSTGAHLDARWADGRRITAADADRYLMVNGRSPSSFGVTSGYGPRSLFGRSFHRGVDFGTPSGSGISLKGGASLLRDLGFTGAGGYAVEIMTPEGPMRLLHLQAGSAGRPGAVASGVSIPALPGVTAAAQKLKGAIGTNAAVEGVAAMGDQVANRQSAFEGITSQLDQQRRSVLEQRQDFDRILELQRSGISPELAQQMVDRERATRAMTDGLKLLERQLVLDLQSKDLTGENRRNTEKLLQDTRDRIAAQSVINDQLTAEERLLASARERQQQIKDLSDSIAQSIGGGLSQAFNVLIAGTENWGDSLRKIASDVLTQIANKLIEITLIQPLTNSLAGGLSGILGGLFGGGAGAGVGSLLGNASGGLTAALASAFADGGIMTADGPVPLRKYAGGGIANSPQLALFGEGSMPEAYVPLPDGRRIPVAMKGGAGGATTVNVSVDASGSQVQGDAGRSEQLGRAVAQAVQQELVRQKRPGGLLAA